MADVRMYKELCELLEELEKWGKKALSQIESPEKAHEAAKELRVKMDRLWEECPVRDEEEKVGIICLVLSALCAIYPIMIFLTVPNQVSDVGAIYADYRTGVGAGSAVVCAIVFLSFGMWLLLHNRKREE